MKIKVKGHKSVSFFSHIRTNVGKLAALRRKAVKIRDLKNKLSIHIATNWREYIDLGKFDFYKAVPATTHNVPGISGNEYQRAVFNTFEAYQRKFERISFNASSFACYTYQINRYKRATKLKQPGDIRSFGNVRHSTNLAKVLNYIAKKNISTTEQLTGFINWANKLESKQPKLVELINQIDHFVSKFGTDRILNLVNSRINRIVRREMANPVVFQSLTYDNFNQFKGGMVVPRNVKPGEQDNWNAYFMVAAIDVAPDNKIAIPIKYSPRYHGLMHHFARMNVPYTIIFEEDRVRITVGYECEREVNAYNQEITGVDLNTKHNLFCTDGLDLDFDRKLVNKAIRVASSDVDEGKKRHYQRAVEQSIKNKIVHLARHLISIGKDHIVIEDIQLFASNFVKINGVRINKLLSTLRFSMIKTWISQIFEKNGIQVTITHAHYSSQQCNKCGHIDKANRKKQEEFKCVSCGHEDNADNNARKNLADRLVLDVPRKGLFTETDGRFIMKRLSKSAIKSTLSAIDTLKEREVVGSPIYSRSI